MPNTYYDSELTGEQMEAALEAIAGVISPTNNGKVLAVENRKIVAKSASEWTDAPVLEAVTITRNGTTTPPSGVDGFNSVTVNVPGAGNIEPITISENGTFSPPSGVDGFAPITVNVAGSAPDVDPYLYYKNYIRSTGTQYINTGFTMPADQSGMVIEIVANLNLSGDSSAAIFGVNRLFFAYKDGGSNYYVCSWKSDGSTGTNYIRDNAGRGAKQVFRMFNTAFLSYSSVPLLTLDGSVFSNASSDQPIYLFCVNNNGSVKANTMGAFDLYNFRIYMPDGTCALNLIPWQEDGVVCLKDTVTGNLLYNIGTGDFVFGTDA